MAVRLIWVAVASIGLFWFGVYCIRLVNLVRFGFVSVRFDCLWVYLIDCSFDCWVIGWTALQSDCLDGWLDFRLGGCLGDWLANCVGG